MRGAIFETLVVTEGIKQRFNPGLAAGLYFWRDNHGTAVDLVFEDAGRMQAVEIKSGTTFAMDWLSAPKALEGHDRRLRSAAHRGVRRCREFRVSRCPRVELARDRSRGFESA